MVRSQSIAAEPRIDLGERIGHYMRRGERDAVQGAFELGRECARRREPIGFDRAICLRQFQRTR